MPVTIKICGLNTPEVLDAALAAGADMVGLVCFPRSPRHIDLETAASLAARARGRAEIVSLLVDPDDALVEAIASTVRPDLIQLHGHETPERVAAIRRLGGIPIMKALGIADAADVARARLYLPVADRLLLDAKAPKDAVLPGGNGIPFDWTLIHGLDLPKPFMLSGGLTPENVAEALRLTGAPGVDVSSGVESAPGRKDIDKIAAFVRAARAAVQGETTAARPHVISAPQTSDAP